MASTALILAGAGMLRGVARTLVADGWHVVLPCRRYSPVRAQGGVDPGRAIWVEARWDEPAELARRVAEAMEGRSVDLLVSWLHETYRGPVLEAVEPLMSPAAPSVEVRPMAEAAVVPEQSGRPTQYVFLGDVSAFDDTRPLGQAEIVAGVRDAVERALTGAPSARHEIGHPRPHPSVPRPRVHGVAGRLPRRVSPAAG
ncbi:hypothetical protein SAXI111661_18295 [Saccharomonospora xinjiangensis]|uniref:hypothetical protein n=1 Tax=Saccharomonospora xinjiangensis TaxID=75294 RepID=UPI00106FB0E0|nr:hypothetical protein [Saccharomonospora xinjiangensis]QBQ61237.1 short chain dehydrogenase [Saccharomonospora xinjiangensis]